MTGCSQNRDLRFYKGLTIFTLFKYFFTSPILPFLINNFYINLHVIQPIQVFCLVLLILTALTISTVNKIEDATEETGARYEDAGNYKASAGWLLFSSSAALMYHVIVIFRFMQLPQLIGKRLKIYMHIVSAFMYM